MFRSATFKLTLWYLALVMLISLVFSVVLYHVATAELARSLHRETARIYDQFPVFDDSPLLRFNGQLSNSTHRILLRLIGFNIIVLFSAGFAGYWLARRTLEPIEAAHEQQKHFTANASHELRTPLTALKMESEVTLMNQQASREELRQTLASNLEEAAKLERLINNLLRLSRLEASELQQAFVATSVSAIAAEAVRRIEPLAAERHISLENKTHATPLVGDTDSLVQLLVILLDNAIKYSPADSTVRLTSRQAGKQTLISVVDQGKGIEPAHLKHVFDRFYRPAGNTSGTASEGYGLGLSIAKLIADMHEGRIVLDSRVGKGTTATVSLPKHT